MGNLKITILTVYNSGLDALDFICCHNIESKMKAILCLAVVCAIAAFAQAEMCRTISDCSHVTCSEADYKLECHNHQCTCTQTGSNNMRSAAADCSGKCNRSWHCVDQVCRCGYGIRPGGN